MKGLKILFLLILFLAAYGWVLGEISQYFDESWSSAFEYDGSAWHIKSEEMIIGMVNYTLTLEELTNYTLGDGFYLKNESLITTSLQPFIVRDEANGTMKEML